jgi:hypothetical protein
MILDASDMIGFISFKKDLLILQALHGFENICFQHHISNSSSVLFHYHPALTSKYEHRKDQTMHNLYFSFLVVFPLI